MIFKNLFRPNVKSFKSILFCAIFLMFASTSVFAQTAPGGVHTDLNLWLKTDQGTVGVSNLSQWTDQSPNNNNAVQATAGLQPEIVANGINYHSMIDFDGTDDIMAFDSDLGLNGDNAFTLFGIMQMPSVPAKTSIIATDSCGDGFAWYQENVGDPGKIAITQCGTDGAFGNAVVAGETTLRMVSRDITGPHIFLKEGGNQITGGDFTYTSSNMVLGETNGLYSDIHLSELLVFNRALSINEIMQVHSYLSLKYGITLDQNTPTDYVDSNSDIIWNATANTGYNNDIFGIGRDDASGLNQKVSKSINSGTILTMALDANFTASNTDALRATPHTNDKQFLMVANNGGATTTQTTEIDNAQFRTRIIREWKVDNTNFTQNINLKFEGFDETWTLYKDIDGDFSSGAISLGTLDGNGEITGVTLADGDYFTLAKNDIIVPTITSFTPNLAGNGDTVTILGTGFTGTTAVQFGDTAASSFTIVSDTEITAVVGTGASGNITVTNPAGSDALSGFTYLVAQYDFEGNALDETDNDHDGIEVNALTYGTGAQGQAVCFDNGPGFIRLPDGLISSLSEFTISLRFKTTGTGAILGYQNVAASTSNSPGNWIPILMVTSDGNLKGSLWTTANNSIQAISATAVNDGNWHQVDFTAGTNSVAIYVDGVLQASQSGASVAHLDMDFNQLGFAFTNGYNQSSTTWEYFNGCLDDILIIDRALTAIEIEEVTALPEPTITSFTPTEAGETDTVVITGTHFDGATQVTFGGIDAASFTVDSNNQITAVLASGASGNVTVTTAGGTATSTSFTYVVQNTAPTVTSTSITSATAESLYHYNIKASDADNDAITWTANTVPAWLTFTSGTLQTSFAGTGATPTNSGDGVNQSFDGTTASSAVIRTGAAAHGDNKLFFTDTEEFGIRYVDANGTVQTWYQGDGTYTNLNPVGIAYDALNDAVYVGDYAKSDIVKIDNTGSRTLLSNLPEAFMLRLLVNANGTKLYASARGGIYEIDLTNNDPDTNWIRVVGTGAMGYSDTGTASTSQVSQPHGMAFDSAGRLVFTDRFNDIIRRVNLATDTIETIAGTQGAGTENGDGGAAVNATFADPSGLVINEHDEIFISERLSKRIRKIDTGGDIDTFFTVATGGFADDLVISDEGELYLLTTTLIAQVATKAELTGTPTNADAGVHNVALTLSDGIDNVPYNFQITVQAINYPPTDITLDTNDINQSATGVDATIGILSTTDADSGDSHTYSLVAGSGDDDNVSFNINGATLRSNSALAPGSYRIRINTNDNTDDFAKEFTVNVIDNVAPEGYTVTIEQDPIAGSNQTAISFTFASAEVGADYDYIFSSEGGGTIVTGSGTITTTNEQISGIDLSGLGEGNITLSVTLTDAAGNQGNAVTDTKEKDTQTEAPILTSPVSDGSSYDNITITYTVPETPLANSVRLVFDSTEDANTPITLQLADPLAGQQNNFSIDVQDLTAAAEVVSSSNAQLINGLAYDVTLVYQDNFGNPETHVVNTSHALETVQITSLTLYSNNTRPHLAKAGDRVYVELVTDREIEEAAIQLLGGTIMVTAANAVDTNTYRAWIEVDENDDEGEVAVNVIVNPNRENITITATTDNSSVTIDTTAPVPSLVIDESLYFGPFEIELRFSEEVENVMPNPIEVVPSNGAPTALLASFIAMTEGLVYSSTVTPEIVGEIVFFNEFTDMARDLAGNPAVPLGFETGTYYELDTDGDGTGDNTDTDDDNDGTPDTEDAFPLNDLEDTDTDGDGTGDNTDTDDDNDGTPDTEDAFPLDDSEDTDTDGDGTGDNADTDDDNDGTPDTEDAFPLDDSEDTDTDGDGTGDNADTDDDNDGTPDTEDAFPLDDSEDTDTDGDGRGDNADTDDDNDGTRDTEDAFPLDPNEDIDTDGDGTGDNEDTDDDGDGTPDSEDAFPLDPNEDTDTDNDGTGDNQDNDTDGDGTPDSEDAFPLDPNEDTDTDGDSTGDNEDTDDDGDGTPDTEDAFPFDPHEDTDTDGDGTGDNHDNDTDGDGTPDNQDAFPLDPNEDTDTDGDGIGDNEDNDDDGDGTPDSEDAFPLDPYEDTDTDGDGTGDNTDNDLDGDGTPNEEDAFPLDPNEDTDSDGDGTGDNEDNDDDNDGLPDEDDYFPINAKPILIPAQAFTPNGDGINDSWMIPGIENYPNSLIKVYNRWGHEVFVSKGYRNDWNGSYKSNSNKLPSGSYMYIIDPANGSAPIQGWLFINY